MKTSFIVIICLISCSAFSQNTISNFNGDTWLAPYTLTLPKGWGYERILLPADFAPEVDYKGIEDLRFTPGWDSAKSNEYWTYAFLWYLDNKPEINSQILEAKLKAYYTGLLNRNIIKRNISSNKLITTKTFIKETKTDKEDLKTFQGKISMLDYKKQKPILFNCVIHFKVCKETHKAFLFFEISPKALTDNVWLKLNQLWSDFNCAKNVEAN